MKSVKATAISRWFFLMLLLVLSGCSTYHASNKQYPVKNLKELSPKYAAISHGQMEYYSFGQGSPIVLIPGYVTDVSSWNQEFLASLAQQHQVIVINNRNVGGSWVESARYESSDLAKDTYQLINKLGLKKPAILGISMGGMIAQQVAVKYGDKLGPLILINTAIAGKEAVHPSADVEKKMLDLPRDKLGRYFLAVDLFSPSSQKVQMAYSLAIDRFKPKYYTEVNPANIIPQQRHLLMRWTEDNDTAKKLKQLHTPVLILNGDADVVIPPINSVILAKTIPNAQLVSWRNGGHAMIYQYPDELAATISEFIGES